MLKRYLMSPGPTPVPEDTLLLMAKPLIHHRTPEFIQIMEEVREGLKYLFQTKNEVLIFASSGTGAMEGTVTNTLSRGDRALVVRGGKFGERWTEICNAYSVDTINIDVTWGEAVDPDIIERCLKKDGSIKAVFTQASETSTGVMHPIKEIAEIVGKFENTIIVVDAISGIGVFDIPTDKWGLDVVITGSQKALMLPPGLSFASVSEKTWKFVSKSNLPKYYFDFKKEYNNLLKNQSAYTPAVSIIIGLMDVLKKIREDGLENIFKRHEKLANATRKGLEAIGLELYVPKSPSNAVTAVKVPPNIDGNKLERLIEDRYGITVAGGQDHIKGKIIRIAHMGYMDRFDVITAISAVEMALNDLGYKIEFGRGVKVAEELLQ